MNKFLISFIILLALYLGYQSFLTDEPNPSEEEVLVSEPEKEKRIIHHYTPKPEVPDVDVSPLLGKYTASVENDKVAAALNIELMADNKIVHYRSINRDGEIYEATVQGEYTIDGDRLLFTFPEERNKEVFKMGMLILTVAKDNTISSGRVKFVKV